MEMSELGEAWRNLPEWVTFLIRCGYGWPRQEAQARRVAIVSMPCDSAAAALVALGAMRRRLEEDDANDVAAHFERLKGFAIDCKSRRILRRVGKRGQFVPDGLHSTGMLWVKQIDSRHGDRVTISQKTAIQWQVDGEPALQVPPASELPYSKILDVLVPNGQAIKASNLQQSDSAICLAGRVGGENITRSVAAGFSLRTDNLAADLSQLLSVHGWSSDSVSRVSFFNARNGRLDRHGRRPALVVADGPASFLKSVEGKFFGQSDVVGIFDRSIDRDSLEGIGQKVADLTQWYQKDLEFLKKLEPLPRGIGVAVLLRK